MESWELLSDIVFLLVACLIGGGLASRMGQSPLVGYLFSGMLVGGPGGIGIVGSQHQIEAIAELGVALLLFSLGLEFSVERLRGLGSRPLVGGAIQVIVTVLVAAGVGLAFGMQVKPATALGAMVALSSTAVVLRILMERGDIEMPHGRNSLGVLLTQDIAVVPLAVVMAVLGGEGTATEVALDVGKLALMAGGLASGLYLLTRVAVWTLGTLTLQRNRELTVIFATAIGLGSACASHAAGISPALGAFIAGMLLGSSAFATQIRADVSSLRVLLLTLFFGSAGMVADPLWIMSHIHWVAAMATAITLGKFLIITVIFLSFKQSLRVSAATGLALAQVGEFAFVLGAIGRESGVVSDETYALIVSVTIVSFFSSALLVPIAPRFGDWLARKLGATVSGEDDLTGSTHTTDAIVIGFGPTGQLASIPLIESHLKVTVIDLNREGLKKAQEFGFESHVGDGTSTDVLEHACISDAKLVIITLPSFKTALAILELARSLNPTATILVRSRYQTHSKALADAGGVVRGDEEQVGGRIGEDVTTWLQNHLTRPS